ncbi:adenylate/guanylate cyclase domain-containing protein [Microvirga antarctica]|uniref:adenylate/guanylate cyclase domain-containing protein n=1 Tax=Microvirga antarctica TaxID=2819233 RepID=UPI001B30F513|nr:adenylate/guanylate cyclase domain-containing protein [Microvirga antarctica]
MDDSTANHLIDWVLAFATANDDLDALLTGLSEKLLEAGFPLQRASISLPTIDPSARAVAYIWWRDRGVATERVPHGRRQLENLHRSVVFDLQMRKSTMARYRLADGEGVDRFDLLREMKERGSTDYLLRLVPFGTGQMVLQGVALSVATDREGGFSDEECAFIHRIVPALALAAYRISVGRIAVDALSVYLGPQTGRRVLAGEIRRGEGERIAAAILNADLKGFTAMTEREDALEVVGWLNEHFEVIGDAVMSRGGEILKFMGDGLLAVFPVSEPDARPCRICGEALEAAEEALAANAALNRRRSATGGPRLDADVVLHYGEVVYGNVGATRRLDFTVIGRAVNEASRMEALCDPLGVNLIASRAFAERCARPMIELGSFSLRGIAGERAIYRPC